MSLAFDIGGNLGEKSEILRKKFDSVVLFEPNPNLKTYIEKKFENSNVIVDNRAISSVSGEQIFYISDYHYISTLYEPWTNNSRFSNDYSWSEQITVSSITLDDAIEEYGIPKYIKLDVEGFETTILKSFNKLLPDTVFSFEFVEEQKEELKLTLNHLSQLGYNNFSLIFNDNLLFDYNITWYKFYEFVPFDEYLDENSSEKWGMIYFKK